VDVPDFSREDLIKELPALKILRGVEIGVERGYFSETIAKANPQMELTSIDPWAVYESGHIEHRTAETVEQFHQQAVERLSKYPNVKIMRLPSRQAVKKFRGECLDFVYIDGDHGFEAVVDDLSNWYAKLRPGGVIAGHDYWGRMLDPYLRVGPAVKLWTKAYRIDPWFTIGRAKTKPEFKKDSARSFVWVKE
jgi:predicted O-methyltransferase YrrM